MKKRKFKFYPKNCNKCWFWDKRYIDGQWSKVKILDVEHVCKNCIDLEKCQASVILGAFAKIRKL